MPVLSTRRVAAMLVGIAVVLSGYPGVRAGQTGADPPCGYVGLRPLPRYAEDLQSNHGGPWAGLPTFEEQKGNYPA